MRINQKTVIRTKHVLLVPYEAHHVATYHNWMQDPAIQEATASEPLTLSEEYENQQSWRTSSDKLTFIVCEPAAPASVAAAASSEPLLAAAAAASSSLSSYPLRGDVNFFIHRSGTDEEHGCRLRGEIDVMIAEAAQRGKGLGRAAVEALLVYVQRNLRGMLGEYAAPEQGEGLQMTGVMAKIREENAGSRALFGKLGFKQEGSVNYFGEVEMVMSWEDVEKLVRGLEGEYQEVDLTTV